MHRRSCLLSQVCEWFYGASSHTYKGKVNVLYVYTLMHIFRGCVLYEITCWIGRSVYRAVVDRAPEGRGEGGKLGFHVVYLVAIWIDSIRDY